MEKTLASFRQWQKTKTGELVSAIVMAGLGYVFFGLSIDRGNLWFYLLTLVFLIYFLKFLFRFLGDIYYAVRK